MTEILLLVLAVLLVLILIEMRKLFKMLDAWRYDWGQRTPRHETNAEIMSEIYGERDKKK